MLGDALVSAFTDLILGLALAIAFAIGIFLVRSEDKHKLPERLPHTPVEPVDFAREIRVTDRTRRGPERYVGGKTRLP